jgi:hypothetical protein
MQSQVSGECFGPENITQANSDNVVLLHQRDLLLISEKICNDKNCKFRHVTIRILNYLLANMDTDGKVSFSARQLSKRLGVHYDTVTKCLKYLRSIDLIKSEKYIQSFDCNPPK